MDRMLCYHSLMLAWNVANASELALGGIDT